MRTQLGTLVAAGYADRAAAGMSRPRADWQARQLARVKANVRYAYTHTQFYRRAWEQAKVDPQQIEGWTDIGRLPVVDRTAWLKAPPDEMAATTWLGPLVWNESSGSTAEPAWTPCTWWDDVQVRVILLAHVRQQGLRWNDASLQLSGRRAGVEARLPTRRIMLGRVEWVGAQESSERRLEIFQQSRAQLVRGGPWTLWRLAVFALRAGVRLRRVKLLASSGETLPETARRTITAAFGAPLVNRYGASDFGQMAADCAAQKLHILPETTYLEILCGSRPAQPGEEGEIVVTSFLSHVRPLIRVRTGDRGAWGEGVCPCGCGLPYLAYVSGRVKDGLTLPAGRGVAWPDVEAALAPQAEQVLGYQVEQTGAQTVIVRLSLRTGPTGLEAIRQSLQTLLAPLSIDLQLTDDFRMEPNGKTLPVLGFTGYN